MRNLRKGLTVDFLESDAKAIQQELKKKFQSAKINQYAEDNCSISINNKIVIKFEHRFVLQKMHFYGYIDNSVLSKEEFSKIEESLKSLGITIDMFFLNKGTLAVIGIIIGALLIAALAIILHSKIIIYIGVPVFAFALVALKYWLTPKLKE